VGRNYCKISSPQKEQAYPEEHRPKEASENGMFVRRHPNILARLVQKSHQFLNLPNVIGETGLHRRRNAKCLVDPAVVVHEVQRDVVGVIQLGIVSFFGGIDPHSGQRSGVARRS
jgi:hypothetical protein